MDLCFLRTLEGIASLEILQNKSLASLSTFKIGGAADVVLYPKSKEALCAALDACSDFGIDHMVIGNASNLLFSDDGYRGAVICTVKMQGIELSGCEIVAECGAPLSLVALAAQKNALTGLEFAYGIPGSLGGAVYMNAGAYGGEMRDVVTSVCVYNTKDRRFEEYTAAELDFSYRHSRFQQSTDIIVSCQMSLKPGDKEEISAAMNELMTRRKAKQPLNLPSAGSVFKRPEGMYAAKLIEDAELKGVCVGGACVSEKHAGFIVNCGGATASDVKQLIAVVKERVLERFGVELKCEIQFVD